LRILSPSLPKGGKGENSKAKEKLRIKTRKK